MSWARVERSFEKKKHSVRCVKPRLGMGKSQGKNDEKKKNKTINRFVFLCGTRRFVMVYTVITVLSLVRLSPLPNGFFSPRYMYRYYGIPFLLPVPTDSIIPQIPDNPAIV